MATSHTFSQTPIYTSNFSNLRELLRHNTQYKAIENEAKVLQLTLFSGHRDFHIDYHAWQIWQKDPFPGLWILEELLENLCDQFNTTATVSSPLSNKKGPHSCQARVLSEKKPDRPQVSMSNYTPDKIENGGYQSVDEEDGGVELRKARQTSFTQSPYIEKDSTDGRSHTEDKARSMLGYQKMLELEQCFSRLGYKAVCSSCQRNGHWSFACVDHE